MTDNQIRMIMKLSGCTFAVGSFAKRFVYSMKARVNDDDKRPLSEKQSNYLAQLFHMYRKQIGDLDHNRYCELCAKAIEQMR